MIEPIHSLAFSIQSNPGVYAVLIGSGVSRAAGIPTQIRLVRLPELHETTKFPFGALGRTSTVRLLR